MILEIPPVSEEFFSFLREVYDGEIVMIKYTNENNPHFLLYAFLEYAKKHSDVVEIIFDFVNTLAPLEKQLRFFKETIKHENIYTLPVETSTHVGRVIGNIAVSEENILNLYSDIERTLVKVPSDGGKLLVFFGLERLLELHEENLDFLQKLITTFITNNLGRANRKVVIAINPNYIKKKTLEKVEFPTTRIYSLKSSTGEQTSLELVLERTLGTNAKPRIKII